MDKTMWGAGNLNFVSSFNVNWRMMEISNRSRLVFTQMIFQIKGQEMPDLHYNIPTHHMYEDWEFIHYVLYHGGHETRSLQFRRIDSDQ